MQSRYTRYIDDVCGSCLFNSDIDERVPPINVSVHEPSLPADAVSATYLCPRCARSWAKTWNLPWLKAVPPLHGPTGHMGRWIVLPCAAWDDYDCDLSGRDVEWWINHVSRKTWWRPEWAGVMRSMARGIEEGS